jgi:ABC-type glycerol-3-phosphate transport system substrate-binding protein
MIRKITGFIILIFITGCSSNLSDNNNLVIWESYNNSEHVVFKGLVKLYNEKYLKKNKIKIIVERVPFDGLLSKIITAAIAKKTPDICRIDIGHIARLAYGGLALNLDDYKFIEKKKELIPIAYNSNLVSMKDKNKEPGKHLYGISDQLTCVALYYNKKLFKKAGLKKPPLDLKQLIEYGKRLTNSKKGIYGLGLNNSLWWHLPFLYLHSGDVLTGNNKKSLIAEKGSIDAFTYLRDLYNNSKIEGGAWKSGAINPDQGFINSKYAMVISGPWNIKAFKSIDFGITLIPGNGKIKSATSLGGSSMIILRKSIFKKEAADFLKFLISYEAQKIWSEKTGQISVNRQVNKEVGKKYQKYMKIFMNQLNYAKPRPNIPNYDRLESELNPIFYSILDKKLGVKEGLKKADYIIREKILPALEE